jgi:hypothetical protein
MAERYRSRKTVKHASVALRSHSEFEDLMEEWPPASVLALVAASLTYRLCLHFRSRYLAIPSVLAGLAWAVHKLIS